MKKKPVFELKKTLVSTVNGSVGSKMFRKCHFNIRNKSTEVLDNGDLACAFYVSTILIMFSLIKELHTTVLALEKDMIDSGWKRIENPRVGSVIIYGPKTYESGKIHRHLGFFVGAGKVVDNSSEKKMPVKRKWNYRKVESIWWHNKLS